MRLGSRRIPMLKTVFITAAFVLAASHASAADMKLLVGEAKAAGGHLFDLGT